MQIKLLRFQATKLSKFLFSRLKTEQSLTKHLNNYQKKLASLEMKLYSKVFGIQIGYWSRCPIKSNLTFYQNLLKIISGVDDDATNKDAVVEVSENKTHLFSDSMVKNYWQFFLLILKTPDFLQPKFPVRLLNFINITLYYHLIKHTR